MEKKKWRLWESPERYLKTYKYKHLEPGSHPDLRIWVGSGGCNSDGTGHGCGCGVGYCTSDGLGFGGSKGEQ
jgi:hypothetical protein